MHGKFFDIQRFVEGGEGGTEGQPQQAPPSTETNETQDSTESKQELKTEIDIDAKISDALAKAQKSFEEMLKKREAAAKKEAERLSKLSDEERQKAEIENGRKELELREKELQRKELMLEMTKVLAERKIPVQFMEYLIAEDNESRPKTANLWPPNRLKTFKIVSFDKLPTYKCGDSAIINQCLKSEVLQGLLQWSLLQPLL